MLDQRTVPAPVAEPKEDATHHVRLTMVLPIAGDPSKARLRYWRWYGDQN